MQVLTYQQDDLIGSQDGRYRITTDKGREIAYQMPTLSEYVTLTPRLVTPLYPADANFVVSLLDIHSQRHNDNNESSLAILEAGTGHGSLTLHLARAIHAANTFELDCKPSASHQSPEAAKSRRAVIHTVDVSAQYSEHAKQIVRGFRQGLYANDVSFHVGDVSDWLHQQSKGRQQEGCDNRAFLDHIILDMPDSHRHMGNAVSSLRANGSLLLFNPSITQIAAAVELVRTAGLPLSLERVMELGPCLTGGKEWDLRAVKPRTVLRAEHGEKLARENFLENQKTEQEDGQSSTEASIDRVSRDAEQSKMAINDVRGFNMICRPKAFARQLGGGFLGVWRKKQARSV